MEPPGDHWREAICGARDENADVDIRIPWEVKGPRRSRELSSPLGCLPLSGLSRLVGKPPAILVRTSPRLDNAPMKGAVKPAFVQLTFVPADRAPCPLLVYVVVYSCPAMAASIKGSVQHRGDAVQVFISWSKETSRQIASALHDWLPLVIQAIEPWMSDQDIAKGTRWLEEIGKQLEQGQVGIVCLRPDNLDSPWIHWEAGALAKGLQGPRILTYLFDLTHSQVTYPLAQFQPHAGK